MQQYISGMIQMHLMELITLVYMKTIMKNEMEVTIEYSQALGMKQNLNWTEK
jgi:hypothetical protein